MPISRSTFLSIGSAIALAIGSLAVALPNALLDSKGVSLPNDAAAIWVREVGMNILALGVTLFLVRRHGDSPTLRAFLFGNAILQLGLLPIEISAYQQKVITSVSGIVPNSLLHVVLASGFLLFAVRMRTPGVEREESTRPKPTACRR
jgi:hypothetical protein